MIEQNPFKWRRFQAQIILVCVRWYLRYSLSYRLLEEMIRQRGLQVDHPTIYRWVLHYAAELEKRSRPCLKACNDSWKVDETSIKIKKTWTYLYRAIDSKGNTLGFLLSPIRDAEAAQRIFIKALHLPPHLAAQASVLDEQATHPMKTETCKTCKPAPRVINGDKNAAYPKAIADLKAMGILSESMELR